MSRPDRPAERDRLAGRRERGRRQEVVGELHRLGQSGPVADPVAAVGEAGEHGLDRERRRRRIRRTSPRACGPARRRRRPTPERRRSRRRSSASSAAIARAARTPIVDVSTTCVVRRSATATISRATRSDAAPSGRLSTTTSPRRATSATAAHVAWRRAELRCGPSDVVSDDAEAGLREIRGQSAAHVAEADEPDGRPSSRPGSPRGADRLDLATGGDAGRRTAVGGDLEQQLVELLVRDTGPG